MKHSNCLILLVVPNCSFLVRLLRLEHRFLHCLMRSGLLYDFQLNGELLLGLAQLVLIIVAFSVFGFELGFLLLHLRFQIVDLGLVLLQVRQQLRLHRLQMVYMVPHLLHLGSVVLTACVFIAVLKRLTVPSLRRAV